MAERIEAGHDPALDTEAVQRMQEQVEAAGSMPLSFLLTVIVGASVAALGLFGLLLVVVFAVLG